MEPNIYCQPERRQTSKKDDLKDEDYNGSTDCHPFWLIRRSDGLGVCNSAVVGLELKIIASTAMKELLPDGATTQSGCVTDFTVTVPCIRNMEGTPPGKEIVVEWKGKREGTQAKQKRVITAFTEGAPRNKKPTTCPNYTLG